MKAYELICVVSGGMIDPPDATTQCISAHNYTAVLSCAPRKAIHLPVSRKDALRHAAKRQAVLEAYQKKGTVFVAKPQQWLSPAQAAAFLSANQALFDNLDTKLCDRAQFQVSVSWDAAKVLSHFREAPELSDLFSAETTTEKLLTVSLARLRARLSRQIWQLVEGVTTSIIALPTDVEMLCNLVVLIPNSDEFKLDTCVEAIDAIWSDGFKVRQIGPSAAGSFALLNLEWVSADDILKAHQALALKMGAPHKDRKTARRRALMQSQSGADEIERAARIVESCVPGTQDGFHMAAVLSEESALSEEKLSEVA